MMHSMLRYFAFPPALFLVTVSATTLLSAEAVEIPAEEAWKALPKYECWTVHGCFADD